jgi:serine/threonine-protein kinase
MSIAGPVSELLLRWEELRAAGQPVSAEELCRDRPELLEEVRRHLRALEAVYRVPRGASSGPETLSEPGRAGAGVAVPPGYELLGELGRGGMGVVYKARQIKLNRLVALKMILAGGHASARERSRFKAEAEAAARLSHPNIVAVYEVGEHDGRPYLVLEYVDGDSLPRRTEGTPLPAQAAAELVRTLARAVQHAHERGVVHRDLKPANVLLASPDVAASLQLADSAQATLGKLPTCRHVPKITDFGLAKMLDEQGQTHTGDVLGTPSYMAPEQAAGRSRDVGPATDVYALGAILYELLTGRPPFKGATVLETIEQVLTQEPVPPSLLQPKVPRELEIVCLKCLGKEAQGRYASAQLLADDLDRFLAGEPISVRGTGLVEQVARALSRSQYDVRFQSWGTQLLGLAILPVLVEAVVFALALARRPLVAAALAITLGTATFIVLRLWLGRRKRDTTGPAERQLWSLMLGQLLALSLMAVVSWPRTDEEALALYPRWAILTGLVFFTMGGTYWGGCYLIGLSFWAVALLMPFWPEGAPLKLGCMMGAALATLGARLRRFEREMREEQHGGRTDGVPPASPGAAPGR